MLWPQVWRGAFFVLAAYAAEEARQATRPPQPSANPETEPTLTQADVAAAMERAQHAICPPLDDRCYGLPFDAAEAFAERTPKGWCLIGWMVRDSGRESWDAWDNVNTGEGRLRKQPDTK